MTIREMTVAELRRDDRTGTAAQALHSAGARVRSLAGGTDAWQRAGLPLQHGR
ncbi:hypothetical protein HS041_29475 [Planomonospora sp. ID67723]|uniref:rhodanese-like domain-containing protein n=1 Tax=Planomonospora sp. ID67723 TaxID=2738134 RepID=UPI0018C372D5|nr:hypothetical protein [Planomonospora sp. ID67723]MBG0831849.1 hypothetical protein [Planomonospora sp. ID67723]